MHIYFTQSFDNEPELELLKHCINLSKSDFSIQEVNFLKTIKQFAGSFLRHVMCIESTSRSFGYRNYDDERLEDVNGLNK